MMSWLFCPLMCATKPTPQASCSLRGSYSPCFSGPKVTLVRPHPSCPMHTLTHTDTHVPRRLAIGGHRFAARFVAHPSGDWSLGRCRPDACRRYKGAASPRHLLIPALSLGAGSRCFTRAPFGTPQGKQPYTMAQEGCPIQASMVSVGILIHPAADAP